MALMAVFTTDFATSPKADGKETGKHYLGFSV